MNYGNFIGFATDNVSSTASVTSGVYDLISQYFYRSVRKWGGIGQLNATGGTISSITSSNNQKYYVHNFSAPGTFTVNSAAGVVEIVVEMSGGAGASGSVNGGGSGRGGGGGSGGVAVARYSVDPGPSSFSITVGSGGAPTGISGSPSTFVRTSPGPVTLITTTGGTGGTNGAYQGSGGTGGTAGSTTYNASMTPLIPSLVEQGVPGNPGIPWPGRGGISPTTDGAGGAAYPGVNTPSYLFFPIPGTVTPRSVGGSSNDGGSGGPGNAGSAGYVRIFYPDAYVP